MAANTYRMTERDITLMIQLRATNSSIFTGRRNSAMRGWRAIRREMGLQGLTALQLKKKWDNLKDKYRVLKNPPVGMETMMQPGSWRWFHLMDEAMSGRLAGTASIVRPSALDEDEKAGVAPPPLILSNTGTAFSGLSGTGTLEGVGTLGGVLQLRGTEACGDVEAVSRTESPAEDVAAGGDGHDETSSECLTEINNSQTAVLYATLLPDLSAGANKPSTSRRTGREAAEVDGQQVELQREWRALEREQAEFDRELIALERDRELLNRDMDTLERDRTLIERDRAAVERERTVLDRDRAFLERDRSFLDRERVFLERAREDLERERALLRRERLVLEKEGAAVDRHRAEVTTEKEVVLHTRFYQSLMAADLDPEQLESRQRLASLFQKLVEKL